MQVKGNCIAPKQEITHIMKAHKLYIYKKLMQKQIT